MTISPYNTSPNLKVLYPFVISYNKLSDKQLNYTLFISSQIKPQNYVEAKRHPKWLKAMESKIKALESNRTWEITDLPSKQTPIECKWIYKIKRRADGKIKRYKARFITKRYTQREGIDYMETYSPVARLITLRYILAVASIMDWHLEQLDVDNAFLHGDLQEEVYVDIPPKITTEKEN